MIRLLHFVIIAGIVLIILWPGSAVSAQFKSSDSWGRLQSVFPQSSGLSVERPVCLKPVGKVDPWQRLRRIVIPFSRADDISLSQGSGAAVAVKVRRKLKRWRKSINAAAVRFAIPKSIIEAVIMVESGGDPEAKAKTSTAAGLMQTIEATFRQGRRELAAKGVFCADNPFDPHASIMVGSWYLRKMFDQARADGKPGVDKSSELNSWHYPLQYYYSGPGHGRKKAPRILIYSGGERILIDKPAYSNKVMAWARNLAAT